MKDIAFIANDFKVVPKVDKNSLKSCVSVGNEINIGKVEPNKTLTIK